MREKGGVAIDKQFRVWIIKKKLACKNNFEEIWQNLDTPTMATNQCFTTWQFLLRLDYSKEPSVKVLTLVLCMFKSCLQYTGGLEHENELKNICLKQ